MVIAPQEQGLLNSAGIGVLPEESNRFGAGHGSLPLRRGARREALDFTNPANQPVVDMLKLRIHTVNPQMDDRHIGGTPTKSHVGGTPPTFLGYLLAISLYGERYG